MTNIFDAPADFATAALAGYAAAQSRRVRLVRSGVVRATETPEGKVALVVGGGSGHFPAFAGYVGQGFADAAVAGDVFASPSTAAVARVCRLAHRGGGLLLGFGNYAGDVLNFGVAAERLRAEGIDVRVVPVTDDVASAGADTPGQRRGIAGTVPVYKIAGAAAETGLPLDEVERLARHANARTVSFGVAFEGCTLPGAAAPLFTVPEGRMGLGLGIHGEPGISEQPVAAAGALAKLLVGKLAPERPAGATRVAAILNGLGATKYEELFVLWGAVVAELAALGLEVVEPEVGEFVTSLDMRGCSLTLVWLDEELEPLWRAPCDAAVLHRGHAAPAAPAAEPLADSESAPVFAPASTASRAGGACVAALLARIAARMAEEEEELGRIDARAGDGDHGQGMARGSAAAAQAAAEAAAAGAGAASLLGHAGDAWADRAGGTSGAIWGLLLRAWGGALSDQTGIEDAAVASGARRALDAVTRLGGARLGDKTLVDALVPFVEALEASVGAGHPLAAAWNEAAAAARRAAEATAALTPKLGRARPLARRSLGHPDAGAISLAICAETAGAAIAAPFEA